jgi:ABC-2 type transport system permease protein
MREILLIARRDYLAYVSAWGFWVSLITAPFLIMAIAAAPLLLTRAEPSRAIAILADQPDDHAAARRAIEGPERAEARRALDAFLTAAAPQSQSEAMAAFDAATDRATGLANARAVVGQTAPGALRAFPNPQPRYVVVRSPARSIEALKPYLRGERAIAALGRQRDLFAAIHIKRSPDGAIALDYWSTNLNDTVPANRVIRGLGEAMRIDALTARGFSPQEAASLEDLSPTLNQFDPHAQTSGETVDDGDRAPFLVAVLLSCALWSAVFGVANMLLTSVLEEKSNKILDSLLTCASPAQILIGKLLGVAGVSATFLAAWSGLGAGLAGLLNRFAPTNNMADLALSAVHPELAALFVLCFVCGYLMYGAMFLGLGALCETNQEAQTLLGPVFLVLTAPILLLAPAFDNPNSPLVAGAAWIPFFTPFIMMMRAPIGLPLTEIVGPVLLMMATVVVVLWLASRLFHAGVVDRADASTLRRRLSPRGWVAPEKPAAKPRT